MHIWEFIQKNQNIELYIILFLFLFTVWFIYTTIRHYQSEKRKLKQLHRFAKEGEVKSQSKLAKQYHRGEMVRKDCQRAAFWYQCAAFNGDKNAKGQLEVFLRKGKKQKKC